MQQWWGCGVLMVVVWGFGFVHGGVRERERDRNERKERDYYCKYIYFITWIYYFNVLNRDIKVGMLDVL